MKLGRGVLAAIVVAGLPGFVHAQVLPQVQLPQLPVETPLNVDGTLNRTLELADPERLRQLRVRDLLRRNRDVVEADPRGAPIVRSEIAALSPTEDALRQAQGRGFEIARRRVLEGLDVEVVILRAPEGVSTRRAIRDLQRIDPQGTYDFNHLYFESGEVTGTAPTAAQAASTAPTAGIRVGLIDGGVEGAHPAFNGTSIQQHGCSAPIPTAHGTAVASLLVGSAGDFHGAAPNALLYSADVYCGQASGGAVDAVVDAFAWMARERVPVINVSLVGPANRILEGVVRVVVARGHVIVAAVGNDGPSSPPLYPAAYPGVIGVTGVDARNRVLVEACRGTHVAFAAPGAEMSAATLAQAYVVVRGTSFAAPIVAGLLATRINEPDVSKASSAIALLASHALDLGSKGQDRIYGKGLVGAQLRMPASLAKSGIPAKAGIHPASPGGLPRSRE
ncbi:subtilisin family serine protease [Povalibacter uvarum]|uniref:Subtilisin family serine protease n=1 Tax=Povalibacter uvarum TaxID=732238 RepID=A0A841HIP0_9GAMM|nr:S8 family serine peptidase [Povalibacter uvarum]MBB6092676.1 subtilisin family serine protease [Povalibacter uvarum]